MEADGKVGTKVTTFKPDGTYTIEMLFKGPVKALVAHGTVMGSVIEHFKGNQTH